MRGLERAERALDLGAGDGRLTELIDAQELTGADVSTVALERARRRLPATVDLVELEPDAPLPFADSAFDLVLCPRPSSTCATGSCCCRRSAASCDPAGGWP